MRRSLSIPLVVALAAPALALLADAGAAAPQEEHCVITVTGESASGQLLASGMRCYDTLSEARSSGARGLRTTYIAHHYDGAGFTGSSLSIEGTTCSGGWLNLPTSWRNRISSTFQVCGSVRHYDSLNLSGSSQTTTGSGGNLTTLDNKAESVQYS
jgi:hypothetical protein